MNISWGSGTVSMNDLQLNENAIYWIHLRHLGKVKRRRGLESAPKMIRSFVDIPDSGCELEIVK